MVSQDKWQNMRALIYQLYVVQGKTLPEVREIVLAQQAFHASTRQWKNQLRFWRIRKNNKRSDMKFALQTLTFRKTQGKDTVFDIHGKTKSSRDVQRYWKRARREGADDDCPPSTPPGIRYGTPEPAEAGSADYVENCSTPGTPLTPENEEVLDEETDVNATRTYDKISSRHGAYVQDKVQSQPSLLHLTLSRNARYLEIAMHSGYEYFLLCMPPTAAGLDEPGRRVINSRAVEEFWDSARNVRAHDTLGSMHASLKIACKKCSRLIPRMIVAKDFMFLVRLIQILANFKQHGQDRFVRLFLHMVLSFCFRAHIPRHPLRHIVQAILDSSEGMMLVLENLSRLLVENTNDRLGPYHPHTSGASRGLMNIFNAVDNYHTLYSFAEGEHQKYLTQPVECWTDYDKDVWMNAQIFRAKSQLKLGNLSHAQNFTNEALAFCDTYMRDWKARASAQCRLLVTRGDIACKVGDPSAVAAYEAALGLSEVLGVDDVTVMKASQRLKQLE